MHLAGFLVLAACHHPVSPPVDVGWHPAPPPPDDNIYFILVDRYANGDPSNDDAVDPADPQAWHGGDIAGVIKHIDDLEAMGVRTVWLSPIYESRQDKFFDWGAFHGYWVEDLSSMEPRFGTEAELRQLSDALHARGMRLVLDVVFNHVAMDAPMAHEKPSWFHHEGGIQDWNDPHQLVFGEVHGLPDLAQENEEVYQYLLAQGLGWIDRVQPDGFRIDAVRHMPLEFLARFSRDVADHTGPGFLLLGEDFQGDALSLSQTFSAGGFGAMFDFPLHYAMLDVFCHDRPVGRLGATLSADGAYADPNRLVPFLDNHDTSRLWTECGGDRNRVEQALTFLLSTRGIPSLNYGTESLMQGKGEPDNRADMRFGDPPLREHIRKLLALRGQHPAIQHGLTRILALEDGFFVYARIDASEAVVVAVNQGDVPRELTWPEDLRTSAPIVDLEDGSSRVEPSVTVAPHATRLFQVQAPRSGFSAQVAAARRQRMSPSERPVQVVVRGAKLDPGTDLVLVGNGRRLTNWKPAEGLGPFQVRGADLVLDLSYPVGEVMEFKLVKRLPDGQVEWQGDPNRYILVGPGADTLVSPLSW